MLGVLALVGVVGLAVQRVTDPPPADGGAARPSASTYPSRVDAPLFRMGELPDRPGPIAGLILRNQGWFAVGEQGQVWRVPGATGGESTSISPDGTRIAYVDSSPTSPSSRSATSSTATCSRRASTGPAQVSAEGGCSAGQA